MSLYSLSFSVFLGSMLRVMLPPAGFGGVFLTESGCGNL